MENNFSFCCMFSKSFASMLKIGSHFIRIRIMYNMKF